MSLEREHGFSGGLPSNGRTQLVLATRLTLGLVAWELLLLWLIAGEIEASAGLGRRLAWDAALFLPLFVVSLGSARRWSRTLGVPGVAARVSVVFLSLLLPVAGARALLQQWSVQSAGEQAQPGASLSATTEVGLDDARFLCSVASRGAGGEAEPVGGPLAVAVAGMRDALPLQAAVFPLALFILWSRGRSRGGLRHEAGVTRPGLLLLLALLATCHGRPDGAEFPRDLSPAALRLAGGCAPDAPVRTYELAAISVDIPLNAYGDHVPEGFMYVLEEDLPAVREQEQRPGPERVSPGLRQDPIQPLVFRANLGECLVVRFTNRLATEAAALRIDGLRFAWVEATSTSGFVPRTVLPAGQRVTYVFPLPAAPSAEGAYALHDPGDGGRREARGLFGALVLEPAGSVYRRSDTGEPSRGTGWQAIIDVPGGAQQDFREVVLLPHGVEPSETADVRLASGELLPLVDEMAGPFRKGAVGFNYRSEPHFERDEDEASDPERRRLPRPKELATPMPQSYLGEPVKLRMLQGGSPEFHAYTLRDPRWRHRPEEAPRAPPGILQLLSPGQGITLPVVSGLDGFPQKAGDFVFFCRMPNHSSGGMRGAWRVLADSAPGLAPLPDRSPQ
jgi:hypothetical protein